jgi:hypothetical protein
LVNSGVVCSSLTTNCYQKKGKDMKRYIWLLMLVVSQYSFAVGKAEYFHVKSVRVDQNGKGIVEFSKPLIEHSGARPSCGSYLSHLAFDVNTEGGKAIYSLVLAARSNGQRIFALGTGNCSTYGVVENWAWGMMLD